MGQDPTCSSKHETTWQVVFVRNRWMWCVASSILAHPVRWLHACSKISELRIHTDAFPLPMRRSRSALHVSDSGGSLCYSVLLPPTVHCGRQYLRPEHGEVFGRAETSSSRTNTSGQTDHRIACFSIMLATTCLCDWVVERRHWWSGPRSQATCCVRGGCLDSL